MSRQRQPLTVRQREFFDYLRARMEQGGGTPSLRTAAEELGVSHTAVAGQLQALQDKGWLRREGRYSRSLVLLDQGAPDPATGGRAVPIIGRVAAGLPLYAQQEWAGSVLVDSSVFRGDNLFALRVQGDSMRDAGILKGDLAICEPRQYATNGEIVVALIGGEEATVKRFFYCGGHIELRPENDLHPVQAYALGEVLIQGRVIGIQRGPEQMAAL
ncbi:MAG: transcriptional repressor LexA [Desulfobulbus sp.]|jgi:repressor LexA|nr:transcriptional repressor LexA [Desulfobulbus sp.]